MYEFITILYRGIVVVFTILILNFIINLQEQDPMTEKNNIKQAVEVSSLLELYHLTIKQNLKRLEKDIKELDTSETTVFSKLQNTDYLDETIKELAETLETIFLKTRHTLSQLPLDTIAQERLETLGVNFQKDIETSEEFNNAVISLKQKFEKEIN